MASTSLDHPFQADRRDREPGLALFGVGAVLISQLMPGEGAWWVAPGLAGGAAALTALVRLVRRRGRALSRPWLGELGIALGAVGWAGLLMVACLDGPQGRVWSYSLALIAAFIGILGLFTLGTALLTRAQDGVGEAGGFVGRDATERRVVLITLLAGGAALLLLAIGTVLR